MDVASILVRVKLVRATWLLMKLGGSDRASHEAMIDPVDTGPFSFHCQESRTISYSGRMCFLPSHVAQLFASDDSRREKNIIFKYF